MAEAEAGIAAGDARHAGAEGVVAGADARVRSRPADWATRGRDVEGRGRDSVSGAVSDRAARLDCERMGRVGQQSPGAVLSLDPRRQKTVGRRRSAVVAVVVGDRKDSADGGVRTERIQPQSAQRTQRRGHQAKTRPPLREASAQKCERRRKRAASAEDDRLLAVS